VGKPFVSVASGVAFFQLTKIGCPPAQAGTCEDVVSYDEAWLFASSDIASASGTDLPTFDTLPHGDVGLCVGPPLFATSDASIVNIITHSNIFHQIPL
jgi:hypothetical protein